MRLSELKAMSPSEVRTLWSCAKFPFDMAVCGKCISMHHRGYESHCSEHQDFLREAERFEFDDLTRTTPNVLEEMFALRLLFAHLYKIPVPADALEEETDLSPEGTEITETMEAAKLP